MTHRLTTIERAYELAKSGECPNVRAIKDRLKSEGRHDIAGQLYGPTVQAALRKLCVANTPPAAEVVAEEAVAEE